MRLLLDHGADLERTTDDDSAMRPLHFAAQTGDQLCVKELLLARADPTAANAEGQTPVYKNGLPLPVRTTRLLSALCVRQQKPWLIFP